VWLQLKFHDVDEFGCGPVNDSRAGRIILIDICAKPIRVIAVVVECRLVRNSPGSHRWRP
jgi:hypothetical protein